MNQKDEVILHGGTTLQDYEHIDEKKFSAFLKWRTEIQREWYKLSNQRQMTWGKKHAKKNQERARVDTRLRSKIKERDNTTCRYCGRILSKKDKIHIDHIHPFSKGGETVYENLVTACSLCNKTKKYLHGITPIPLENILQLGEDTQGNFQASNERRKQLMYDWSELSKDRKQHNLEAEVFFYRYDICNEMGIETLKSLLTKGKRSAIDRVYDIDGWIATYLINEKIKE